MAMCIACGAHDGERGAGRLWHGALAGLRPDGNFALPDGSTMAPEPRKAAPGCSSSGGGTTLRARGLRADSFQ
eukprot:SAG11_NODE_11392_length_763_cov_2.971386_1_plen_73_part_00